LGLFLGLRRAATLWSYDFLTQRILTRRGIKHCTALVFMHIESRRVLVTKAAFHPTRTWVSEAAECFADTAERLGLARPTILVRDNDVKFGAEFDESLRKTGVSTVRLPFRAPLMNAHVERWIKSHKVECLDHCLPVRLRHFDYLVSEYVEHYHTERPHQGIGNRVIASKDKPDTVGKIQCSTRLGGLLRHYHRAA
jgi:putative transposase